MNLNKDKMIVKPNPFTDKLQVIVYSKGTSLIEIRNSFGQKVNSASAKEGNTVELNLSNLPDGIYFVQAYNSSGDLIETKRVVKN